MKAKFNGAFFHMTEKEDFVVHMEYGQRSFYVVHFYTPMNIMIDNKTFQTAEDACVIIRPSTPYVYSSIIGEFLHDYCYFECDEKELKRKFDLPLDELFYIDKPEQLNNHFGMITWSLTDVLGDHQDEMEDSLENLLTIMQNNRILNTPKELRKRQMNKQLYLLREEVKKEPMKWNVSKMANSVYLTRSHFSVVYRTRFGITPGQDIKCFLINYADTLIKTTNMSIGDIAFQCGYSNEENFIRMFKTQTGISPNRLRKISSSNK